MPQQASHPHLTPQPRKKKIIFYNPTLVGGPSEEGNWVIGGIGVGIAIKKLNLFALFNDIGSVYLGL